MSDRVEFGELHPDGRWTPVGSIRQSDIARCRWLILDIRHYRADGSCKCDEPAEQARLIHAYGYTSDDFLPPVPAAGTAPGVAVADVSAATPPDSGTRHPSTPSRRWVPLPLDDDDEGGDEGGS